MRVPHWLMRWMRNFSYRQPDLVIGGAENPYLFRWFVIPRNRFFNIYLHLFMRSDDDRALHDHPWMNASWLLDGSYTEHTKEGSRVFRTGQWRFRWSGKLAHRVELTDGPVWTLFFTGPRYREWGFHCPQGWRHWKDFLDVDSDYEKTGKGVSSSGKGCN